MFVTSEPLYHIKTFKNTSSNGQIMYGEELAFPESSTHPFTPRTVGPWPGRASAAAGYAPSPGDKRGLSKWLTLFHPIPNKWCTTFVRETHLLAFWECYSCIYRYLPIII